MYEFNGWFVLAESSYDGGDPDRILAAVQELEDVVDSFSWPNVVANVRMLNGLGHLGVSGRLNRRREEATAVWDLIELAAARLPASWGLMYERDDEADDPPGGSAYKVTVLARGRFMVREDVFLSPCSPIIED